uniref:Uncharacterized protein n=1 Tax=Lepeophtheirus salmonis TaxID=72036 RepID=A0A0K2U4C0_LEPSM
MLNFSPNLVGNRKKTLTRVRVKFNVWSINLLSSLLIPSII